VSQQLTLDPSLRSGTIDEILDVDGLPRDFGGRSVSRDDIASFADELASWGSTLSTKHQALLYLMIGRSSDIEGSEFEAIHPDEIRDFYLSRHSPFLQQMKLVAGVTDEGGVWVRGEEAFEHPPRVGERLAMCW
jgi:hypothetical protein